MKELLRKYESKRPEIVFEWKDAETEAEGWVVINSLRGNAAGGGTRMRKGLDKREVESLAKTMEVKFTVCGPAIGGAKSGINFDPADPRKEGVLKRWYKAVMPLLKNYYGTGGDLNVDEIHEVIPITENYGLLHPQEGIVNGHFGASDSNRSKRISNLREGVLRLVDDKRFSPDPSKGYVIADMITGYGVAESVKHFYEAYNEDIIGKRAIIQGWGNVGAAAAWYLAQMGVLIVGIIDREGGLINEAGFSKDEITDLFLQKKGNQLIASNILSKEEVEKRIWDVSSEIFIPAAASRLVTSDQVKRMKNAQLEVIACGANVPFNDPEIFFGATMEYADAEVSIIPDFISNCGMARVFAYLMQGGSDTSAAAIFTDTSNVIRDAVRKVASQCPTKKTFASESFRIALEQLIKA